ncbi:MAG: rod shape-determining protein MreD [Planctomycetes bacterium]|nr:rod shape-determining protein MreD [Planctomycetota bacterium]MBI3833745.1 rod shape-determining protein MreD [Planctomycetota bacterium]
MRWLPIVVLNAAVVALQAALGPFLAVHGIRPDWLVVMAVFWGLYARGWQGVISAWILGAVADLITIEKFGLQMLSYAMAATLVTSIRLQVFRYRWSAQFSLTLLASFLLRMAWAIYASWRFGPLGRMIPGWFAEAAFISVYSAAWAPLLHSLLLRQASWFGIPRQKTRHLA